MALLKLNNVSKHFGGVKAISDVTLSVPAGKITGLIGPNGAGKSTVVNLITGMFALTGGTIELDGIRIETESPDQVVRRGISRTFQNIRLLHEASVLANVMLGFHRHENVPILAELLQLPSSRRQTRDLEARARKLLHRFGIGEYADMPADALPYGHQRRVEMARAVASEPSILLLDEPVAGMNDVEADELGVIFRDLANSGIGLLLIEHNVRFVASICDSVNVLDTGRIIASGTAREVMRNPAVIEAYLGTSETEEA
jgi:branched-chain amino acid transport system ATP-binding protein